MARRILHKPLFLLKDMHSPLFRRLLFVATFVLTLLVAAPVIYSHAVLNMAQLLRINGKEDAGLFDLAWIDGVSDNHVRWQVGESKLRQGNFRAAAQILLPGRNIMQDNLQSMSGLVKALAFSGSTEESIKLYEALGKRPALMPTTAARLWLDQNVELACNEGSIDCHLLSIAIGHPEDKPEFSWLMQLLKTDDASSKRVTSALLSYLNWRARASLINEFTGPVSEKAVAFDALLGWNAVSGKLGNELIKNGTFSDLSRDGFPTNWMRSYMSSGEPWNHGLFVLGLDSGSARIDGMAINQIKGLEPARAGLWYQWPITIPAKTGYIFSFKYRTYNLQALTQGATFWLTYANGVTVESDQALEPTNGRWHTVRLVDWNKSDKPIVMQPLLRSFGLGTVWFDNVSLRLVHPDKPIELMKTSIFSTAE